LCSMQALQSCNLFSGKFWVIRNLLSIINRGMIMAVPRKVVFYAFFRLHGRR
jgi:hypothetical protein